MTEPKIDTVTIKPNVSFLLKDEHYRIIELSDEVKLDNHIENIKSYMKTTNGWGKTEEQKDMDYAFVQNLWRSYRADHAR